MKTNMFKWAEELMPVSSQIAFPIITYPGLALINKSVLEMTVSGAIQFQCINALAQRFPKMPAIPLSMDLSLEAEAFGSKVKFSDDEVPTIVERLIHQSSDIEIFSVPQLNSKRIIEYLKAVDLIATAGFEKPVFGGVIGPFSLAGRLLDMTEIMTDILIEPDLMHQLLSKCTRFIGQYIEAQINAGANGVIMAEPAAGLLAPDQCNEFSSFYVKQLVDKYQNQEFIIMLHNCGQTETLVESMVATGAKAFHFGNAVDMMDILPQIPADRLVFGNLDPANLIKTSSQELIKEKVYELRRKTQDYKNFIISSGCDIPPGTPLHNIDAFFN